MPRLSWAEHAAIHEALQASCGKALTAVAVAVEDADEDAIALRHDRGVIWTLSMAYDCTTPDVPRRITCGSGVA